MNNFEYIDSIGVLTLKSKIKKFNSKDWNNFDFRQKTFEVHKKTKTIPLIYDKSLENIPIECEHFKMFSKELLNIFNILKLKYKKGHLTRAILVNLIKNSKIDRHIDDGYALEKCLRFHIPIITNNKVLFTVDNETIHMKAGEIWKIDNTNKYHSVENNSKIDRVHLIVDWLYG